MFLLPTAREWVVVETYPLVSRFSVAAQFQSRMFLRSNRRIKDGKEHRYFSIVESRRLGRDKVVQRPVLYLGEINDSQEAAWRKSLEVFDEVEERYSTRSLFPDDRPVRAEAIGSIQVKLAEMELRRPRAFGNCWLGCHLWQQLGLDEFWRPRLSGGVERVKDVKDAEPIYRLITTILDPNQAPAKELAALYHERWEIETALDELKTHLRGAQIVLRSKTPELVEQEFWGLLMAHFAIRGLMHEAALRADEDPDRLSFLHSVRVVQRRMARYAAIPPSAEESPA